MRIESIRARAVNVPMNRPLVTGGGSVATAPLVLIDLETDKGVVGRSYVFAISPMLSRGLVSMVQQLGNDLTGVDLRPRMVHQTMNKRLRLAGVDGLLGWVIAGIDMAVWDAHARWLEEPLYRVLGGASQPIAAYNSNGLGLIGPEKAGPEAAELAEGFGAVKLRLGYDDIETDVMTIAAVMDAVPEGTPVMSDYNQSLDRAQAKMRFAAIDDMGLEWIEEPLTAEDVGGYSDLRQWSSTPIQLGENARSPRDILRLIQDGAGDLLMPDVVKIGGVTNWLRAAELCASAEVPISTHLFPEFSVHMMATCPTAHWLEFVDWAAPVIREPLEISDGYALPPDRPGAGIDWNEEAVSRYLVP